MLKFNTHAHSVGRSGCGKVEAARVAETYREAGYDGLVLTNHYMKWVLENYYPPMSVDERVEFFLDAYRQAKARGEEIGLSVFLGMELNLERYNVLTDVIYPVYEFLVFGLTEDFLRAHPFLYELSQREAYELFDQNGMLMVQTHPFRERTRLADVGYLHGIEVYNGHPGHESHNEFAREVAKNHPQLIRTAGDDYHEPGRHGYAGMYFPDDTRSMDAMVRHLKAGEYEIFVTDKKRV